MGHAVKLRGRGDALDYRENSGVVIKLISPLEMPLEGVGDNFSMIAKHGYAAISSFNIFLD